MTTHSTSLPVIDLARLHATEPERATFLAELRGVLRDHGFFYLKGHGVAPELISDTLTLAKRFFRLPETEKEAIAMIRSPHFRGYTGPGREYTRGEPDWREQLDINTEAEAIPPHALAHPWQRLIGPNQWPEALPELRSTLLTYQAEVTRVGIEVLRAVALALGRAEDTFESLHSPDPTRLLKIIRYPGRRKSEGTQGVGPHKDGGLVTILLQDEVPGLRVRTEDGVWIDAPPVPGSFIVNTGELLEMATDGFIRADVHDVLTPPEGSERHSIAFFLGARLDAEIEVIDLPPEVAALKRGLSADRLNPLFREVGRNQLKSRLRSHPDVARRWHADLATGGEYTLPERSEAY